VKGKVLDAARSAFIFAQLMRIVPDPRLRTVYRRELGKFLRQWPSAALVFGYLMKCVMHFHHHTMARDMLEGRTAVVNPY
jgi:hypothetical protein